jgi:helicase
MNEPTPTTNTNPTPAVAHEAAFSSNSEAQTTIFDAGLLDSGINFVLQMPTGGGKTWLAGNTIAMTLARGQRAIYLTPLKALARELLTLWQPMLAPYGQVGVFTGDFGSPGKPRFPVSFEDARLLVMTPERLDLVTRNWRRHAEWLGETGLLVVDELHLLGDGNRGARLEGTISRFRRLNPMASVMAMSATLGNREELAAWLDATEFVSDQRPVPLTWKLARFRRSTEKPEVLAREVARNIEAGGKSLVFVQSRRRAEELANYLRGAGLRAAHHHAGLSAVDRVRVEDGFRNTTLDVIVATSTLEMGLNLPASQVVIYDNQVFDNGVFRPLPVVNVWQRVGRAGRPGLDSQGEAVIICPSWDQSAAAYERGQFEPVLSRLTDRPALAEQIVVEVASGLARTEGQLVDVFGQSLAAQQGRLPNVPNVVSLMRRSEMLQRTEDSGRPMLRATRLGRVAARLMLSPETVLHFRRVFNHTHELSIFDLLLVAACAEDCDVRLPANFEELEQLASILARTPSYLLQMRRRELAELLGLDGRRLLSAIKTASVATGWTHTGDAGETATAYGCDAADVPRLKDTMTRISTAMLAVLRQLRFEEVPAESFGAGEANTTPPSPLERRLRALNLMLLGGIPETSASLFDIKGIGFRIAKKLREVTIIDADALARADWGQLGQLRGISAGRARAWVYEAARLVAAGQTMDDLPEAPRPLLAVVAAWPEGVDHYRFTRALSLTVTTVGEHAYRVTGGSEPHAVTVAGEQVTCDCADAAKENVCKHALAVRLKRGDQTLTALAGQTGRVSQGNRGDRINLQHLWTAEGSSQSILFDVAA